MNILNALLAFSVTMLLLSTMAIVVVEFYYRIGGVREQYFEKMMAVFFDELIWPRVKPLFSGAQCKASLRRQFQAAMMSVSGLPTLDIKNVAALQPGREQAQQEPLRHTGSKKTERLSTIEFAQRFARTDCGIALMNAGEQTAKTLIVDLARQLDSISKGSTSDFRQRSRKCSGVVAFVLAFILNVDALYLLRSYANDKSQAQNLWTQQWLPASTISKTPDTKQHAVSVPADSLPVVQPMQLTQYYKNMLQESSIPIGWQYYPFCRPINGNVDSKELSPDARCMRKSRYGFNVYDADFVSWLLGFVLAGFLIGQGSPFWFQVFQRLSLAAVLVRDVGARQAPKHSQSDPAQASASTENPVSENLASDPVDAFINAAKAQQLQSDR